MNSSIAFHFIVSLAFLLLQIYYSIERAMSLRIVYFSQAYACSNCDIQEAYTSQTFNMLNDKVIVINLNVNKLKFRYIWVHEIWNTCYGLASVVARCRPSCFSICRVRTQEIVNFMKPHRKERQFGDEMCKRYAFLVNSLALIKKIEYKVMMTKEG